MPDSGEAAVEAFEAWCEDLAAKKARNAVPGEPAAPLVNATMIPTDQLVDAFQRSHPEFAEARSVLATFAEGIAPGLEVDKSRWEAIVGA